MLLAFLSVQSKALGWNGHIELLPKYESFKMPPIRLLIYMVSASSVPNLVWLYLKIAHIRGTTTHFSLNDFWHSDDSRTWRSKTPTTWLYQKTAYTYPPDHETCKMEKDVKVNGLGRQHWECEGKNWIVNRFITWQRLKFKRNHANAALKSLPNLLHLEAVRWTQRGGHVTITH